jgi:hypothetical protein
VLVNGNGAGLTNRYLFPERCSTNFVADPAQTGIVARLLFENSYVVGELDCASSDLTRVRVLSKEMFLHALTKFLLA